MIHTIYKHTISCTLTPRIYALPKDAEILSVIAFRDDICVYTKVELPHIDFVRYVQRPKQDYYEFTAISTGRRTDLNNFTFLGTVFFHDGGEVYHIFYRKTSERDAMKQYGDLDKVPDGYNRLY